MTQRPPPTTQDSASLDLALPENPLPKGHNESSQEYCEETDTHHSLPELLKQFLQLKDNFQA